MVRELVSAELESSRQKGIDEAREIVGKFPEDMSTDDKLEKLCTAFRLCSERCLNPLLDNFDPDKHFIRKNHKKGADLKILLLGSFKCASKMEEIVDLMDDLGRGRMNGHTKRFLDLREECDSVRYRLYVARQIYTNSDVNLRNPLSLRPMISATMADVGRSVRNFFHARGPHVGHG